MNEGTGFAAFALYNAIKLHFTSSSYDYFKYNGKTNVSKDTFMKNKTKYTFYKLSRKYSLDELKSFYVSNFLKSDISWIGEIASEDGEETYKKWQKRNQSLTYVFENDILYLFERYNPDDLLKTSGDYPKLLTELMGDNICIETVVILNDIMNFIPMWKKKIQDDIIWPNWDLRIRKYTPFVIVDKKKFKSILKEKLEENA